MTEQGEGFKEMLEIYIQSDVGFNVAELLPKLCIDRISNDDAKEPTFQDQVVTVIDCVGVLMSDRKNYHTIRYGNGWGDKVWSSTL